MGERYEERSLQSLTSMEGDISVGGVVDSLDIHHMVVPSLDQSCGIPLANFTTLWYMNLCKHI